MIQLIHIKNLDNCGNLKRGIDGRELHQFLGVGRKFNGWIEGRILDYGFQEDLDYVKVRSQTGPNFKRLEVEYILSLDMAKELAMVERTDKGREARKYFIEVEKRFNELKGLDNLSWKTARQEGKQIRRLATDIYAIFIDYAKAQGSSSADKYYINLSKMVNSALLELADKKPKNIRDHLNVIQLQAIAMGENIIAKSLVECIQKGLYYKDSYQIAKANVAKYAESVGRSRLGQTPQQTMGLLA